MRTATHPLVHVPRSDDACNHECHKQRTRDAYTITMLRRELEAAREAIEELERDIQLLELDCLPM